MNIIFAPTANTPFSLSQTFTMDEAGEEHFDYIGFRIQSSDATTTQTWLIRDLKVELT